MQTGDVANMLSIMHVGMEAVVLTWITCVHTKCINAGPRNTFGNFCDLMKRQRPYVERHI